MPRTGVRAYHPYRKLTVVFDYLLLEKPFLLFTEIVQPSRRRQDHLLAHDDAAALRIGHSIRDITCEQLLLGGLATALEPHKQEVDVFALGFEKNSPCIRTERSICGEPAPAPELESGPWKKSMSRVE